jgi:hypothetical protein
MMSAVSGTGHAGLFPGPCFWALGGGVVRAGRNVRRQAVLEAGTAPLAELAGRSEQIILHTVGA